jgi:hypothetical protein
MKDKSQAEAARPGKGMVHAVDSDVFQDDDDVKEFAAMLEEAKQNDKGGPRINYRKLAFAHYEQDGQVVCAHCGFGIRDVLEVAHLDGDRSNNDPTNLAILCPNCHKMHDLDLISTETIILMRDRPKIVVWAKRMKDAGKKAAESRRKTAEKLKWKKAGLKAAETRKRNADRSQSQ